MGACYDVTLSIKVKDEKKAIETLKRHIDDMQSSHKANYCIPNLVAEGVDPDTFDGLMRIFLAGWKDTPFVKRPGNNGFTVYENSFNARYGWEYVMIEFFKAFAPCLEDDSEFYIYPDDDYDEMTVKNGECIILH